MSRRLAVLTLALLLLLAVPAGAAEPRARAEAALQAVKDARAGKGQGRELTPLLRRLARTYRALGAAERRQAESILARPSDRAADPYGDGYANGTTISTHCSARFCFHWVSAPASDADAPDLTDTGGVAGVPDYIESMAASYDEVFACENGNGATACGGTPGLQWAEAPSDGALGGDGRLDVYLKDLFTQGFYGYVATDAGQPNDSSQFSYMVMDKDFSRFATPAMDDLDPMRVTAAHEYNHVLQNGYDAFEDSWMFEATATWAEEKVYPAVNDYIQYLSDWVAERSQPLTTYTSANLKVYGSAVWNHWLSSRHGDDVTRSAWAQSASLTSPLRASFSPDAYTKAIGDMSAGSTFSSEFELFAARTSEWRVPASGFPDDYPAVPRDGTVTLTANAPNNSLDHTTYALYNVTVPAGSHSKIRFTGTVPAGTRGAVALVGRDGTETGGTLTTDLEPLPSGGSAHAELENPGTFERITAVLVNSDVAQTFNPGQGWKFENDKQTLTGDLRVPPAATTGAASSITAAGASIAGTVTPNGEAATWKVEYGTTSAYGSATTPVSASGTGTTPQAVNASLSGLDPATTYHYRVVATNGVGSTAGADQTFTTGAAVPAPPVATTGAATSVGATGATLSGTVDPNFAATSWHFEYGTTTAYGSTTPGASAGSGGAPQSVAASLSGLTPGTTYHYRLVASSSEGQVTGSDQTFTTNALPPVATTTAATSVATTSATLNGTVNPGHAATSWHFEYGTTPAYGSITTSAGAGSGGTTQPVSAGLTGLAPGTTYHYRLVASNSEGEVTGSDLTFTTDALPPVATTSPATNVAATTATLNGTVNPGFGATTWHFEYGTTTAYGSVTPDQGAGSGGVDQSASAALAGLTPGTTYHYRVVAENSEGVSPGADRTFTTAAVPSLPGPSPDPGPVPAPSDPFAPLTPPQLTPPDTRPPLVALTARARQRRATALRRGVAATTRFDEVATVVAELVLDRRTARRLRVGTRLARRAHALAAPGTLRLALRPGARARRALGRLRSVRVTVRVTVRDAAGNTSTARRLITLR